MWCLIFTWDNSGLDAIDIDILSRCVLVCEMSFIQDWEELFESAVNNNYLNSHNCQKWNL
jgi:hypothetical protein